jgi:hypothetical protein
MQNKINYNYLIYSIIANSYRSSYVQTNINKLDYNEIKKILNYAQMNGVLLIFSTKLFDIIDNKYFKILLSSIIKKGLTISNKYKNTLKLLSISTNDIKNKYVVVKTVKPYHDVTFDIDIIAEKVVTKKLIQNLTPWFTTKSGLYSEELIPRYNNLCSIDIYWNLIDFAGIKKIVNESEQILFDDIQISVPHLQYEMAFYIENSIRKNYLDLNDVININYNYNKIINKKELNNYLSNEEKKILSLSRHFFLNSLLEDKKYFQLPAYLLLSVNNITRFQNSKKTYYPSILEKSINLLGFFEDIYIKKRRPQYGNWYGIIR